MKFDRPEFLLRQLSVAETEREACACFETLQSTPNRCRSRNVTQGQEIIDSLGLNLRTRFDGSKNSLELAREIESSIDLSVVERLLAETIPNQMDLPGLRIVKADRKHAFETPDAIDSVEV